VKFVVAGGGVAGLAASLALARAGNEVVVLERDRVHPGSSARAAFDDERRGIPHYFQPHAFLPRGRLLLSDWAPDVLDTLLDAGADPQDLALKLRGPREPEDEELVYLWVRRPIIEWALRRAAAAEPAVDIRAGVRVTGLLTSENEAPRATGVAVDQGGSVRGDVVVDALGRYRCPPGWPRAAGEPTDSGAIYYCRYFELADGVEHLDAPILNPRGDLGYMGFNTFRGDNRTFAVILLAPAADRALRVLRHGHVWRAACSAITPLDVMTSADYARPITDVMPMGGLMNVDRTGDPGASGMIAVGDAFCHTDPAFAYGLSFALAHARALADATAEAPDVGAIVARYRAHAGPEARERHALVCSTDAARSARWKGEPLEFGRRDGCYPLFSLVGALAAAPHDDAVLRRTIRRIGLLDRTAVFDEDDALHDRIEAILGELAARPASPVGPPREEFLARLGAARL
jgi:2-polyprenyl-6-methoxyphenol hydroxylase-like FAD-dependent oxidoreductase